MSRQPPAETDAREQQASGTWRWGSTPKTRRVLLDAARQVFSEQGFSQASIADVVQRSGSSVGSLYHHFGGKSELFLALWHEHQRTHEEAASKAVARLRTAGVTDTTELFCAGARAYMEGSWLRRDLALLFFSGDGPPGFEVLKRRRGSEWVARNDVLLGLPDTPLDRLYAATLTSLIGEGARQVASAPARRQADQAIEAVLEYARRLLAGGPWRPPGTPEGAAGIPAVLFRTGHGACSGARSPITTGATPRSCSVGRHRGSRGRQDCGPVQERLAAGQPPAGAAQFPQNLWPSPRDAPHRAHLSTRHLYPRAPRPVHGPLLTQVPAWASITIRITF